MDENNPEDMTHQKVRHDITRDAFSSKASGTTLKREMEGFDKNCQVLSTITSLGALNFTQPRKTVASSEQMEDKSSARREQGDDNAEDGLYSRERQIVSQYVHENAPVFIQLEDLRVKGWNNPEGDEYFKKQKYHTDNADRDTSKNFLNMMHKVADQMQRATGIFSLPGKRPTVLGFAFAPGGFLQKVLDINPDVQVIGVTLSDKVSGIPVLIRDRRLKLIPADITLMAADLGLLPDKIPADHPDAKNFLSKQIRPRQQFDLVTCEGGVLRPHHIQTGSHREHGEAHRLKASQLALALARVKSGGSMIVLLHKAETWNSLSLFYVFSKFSKIRLFKPEGPHQFKSSFYMLATNIQSQSAEARAAVQMWTREWKVATFGTNEEYVEEVHKNTLDVDTVLKEFGSEWIGLSHNVWDTQLRGLKAKSFTQDCTPGEPETDTDAGLETDGGV